MYSSFQVVDCSRSRGVSISAFICVMVAVELPLHQWGNKLLAVDATPRIGTPLD